MSEIDIIIRKATPSDATKVQIALSEMSEETDFLTLTRSDMQLPEEIMASQLADLYDSNNNLLLLALDGEKIIGIASVKADNYPSVKHIGEVGICIYKDYWNMGLGTLLLEETLAWSTEESIIKRLELKVQVRNNRAYQLYKKLGFKTEAKLSRGVLTSDGDWSDVYLMSLLIN